MEGQEPTTTEQPTGQEPAQQQQDPTTPVTQAAAPKTYDENYVTGLRRESGDYRTQLRNAQQALTSLQPQLTEAQTKAQTFEQENLSLKAQIAELRISTAASDIASQLGAIYPQAVIKLLNNAEVEFNSDGSPKNVKELIVKLRSTYPAMFRNVSPVNGGNGAQPVTHNDMTQLIRNAVNGQMRPV